MDDSRTGAVALDIDAFREMPHHAFAWHSFNLRPIGTGMAIPGIGEAVLKPSIIRQQEEAFTILVQPTHRINIPYGDIIPQRAVLARKLAHHTKRLIEEDMTIEQAVKIIRSASIDLARPWPGAGSG